MYTQNKYMKRVLLISLLGVWIFETYALQYTSQDKHSLRPVFSQRMFRPPLSPLQEFARESGFVHSATDYPCRYGLFELQRERVALRVNFCRDVTDIDPDYMENRAILEQVDHAIHLITADPNASLKKIVILGLAPPEGSVEKNDRLGTARAHSLKHIVSKWLQYDPDLFEIINVAEDWQGLKCLIQGSSMPNRWAALEIIDQYAIQNERQAKLMELQGGEPYRYMIEHFFPLLRDAVYVQIYYEYHPKPDLDILYFNRALALMNVQEYASALVELEHMESQERINNFIGVCYLMAGDYALAKTYFNRAVALGDEDAAENLKRMVLWISK